MRTTLRSLNPSSRLTFTGGSHFRAYSNDVPRHLAVMAVFRARAPPGATSCTCCQHARMFCVISSALVAYQRTSSGLRSRARLLLCLDLYRDDVCRALPEHMRMFSCGPSLRVPSPSRPRGKLSDQHLRLTSGASLFTSKIPMDPGGQDLLQPVRDIVVPTG